MDDDLKAVVAELERLAKEATHQSWAAFTDDSGPRPHTNLVSFTPRTDVALAIPGAHKRDPNVAFIDSANPATILRLIDALRQRDEALEFIAEGRDVGRHDGLPEDGPAHDADTMFAVARAILTGSETNAR